MPQDADLDEEAVEISSSSSEAVEVPEKDDGGTDPQPSCSNIGWTSSGWRLRWTDSRAGKRRQLRFGVSAYIRLGFSEKEAARLSLSVCEAVLQFYAQQGHLKAPQSRTQEEAVPPKVGGVSRCIGLGEEGMEELEVQVHGCTGPNSAVQVLPDT